MNIKNIILDLDNTLICSIEKKRSKVKEDVPLELRENKILQPKYDKEKKLEYVDMEDEYRVFLRPHLQEFLDFIFANFTVSVFTLASKDYALFIIKHIILIKPERKLDYILYDLHGDVSEKKYDNPKWLDMLFSKFKLPGYQQDNTLIIDDNKDVWKRQSENVIKAKFFDAKKKDAAEDEFLLDAMGKLRSGMSGGGSDVD